MNNGNEQTRMAAWRSAANPDDRLHIVRAPCGVGFLERTEKPHAHGRAIVDARISISQAQAIRTGWAGGLRKAMPVDVSWPPLFARAPVVARKERT